MRKPRQYSANYVRPLRVRDRIMLCSSDGDLGVSKILGVSSNMFVVRNLTTGGTLTLPRARFYYMPPDQEIEERLELIIRSRTDTKLRKRLGLPAFCIGGAAAT